MKVLHYERVSSTNDVALRLVAEGAEDRTVVTASEQTEGRGRRGASWVSPPGANLYFSLILRPDIPFEPARVAEFAFVAAIAIAKTLRQMKVEAGIKWPNDVLVKDRKISGILVESSPSREAVVIGVGINVNWTAIPEELVGKATSIALETERTVPIEACLNVVLQQLDESLKLHEQGFAKTLSLWRSLECTSGRKIRTMTEKKEVTGTAVGIDEQGGLLVQLSSGDTIVVTAAGALIED